MSKSQAATEPRNYITHPVFLESTKTAPDSHENNSNKFDQSFTHNVHFDPKLKRMTAEEFVEEAHKRAKLHAKGGAYNLHFTTSGWTTSIDVTYEDPLHTEPLYEYF